MNERRAIFRYHRLAADDVEGLKQLSYLFGTVFDEPENYHEKMPTDDYLLGFLRDDKHIVMVARTENNHVVGGLVAYILQKFEMKRSEIYVYDLAVLPEYHRQGIATHLFENLKTIAKQYDAHYPTWEIFVQADKDDEGAVNFYRTINTGELEALHFEIKIK